jgi:hypothetical protein
MHKLLQRHFGNQLNKLTARVITNISGRISRCLDHLWHVLNLPKECAFQNKFDVVTGSAVEFKGHVLGAAINLCDNHVSALATASSAPTKRNNFGIRRHKERTSRT